MNLAATKKFCNEQLQKACHNFFNINWLILQRIRKNLAEVGFVAETVGPIFAEVGFAAQREKKGEKGFQGFQLHAGDEAELLLEVGLFPSKT